MPLLFIGMITKIVNSNLTKFDDLNTHKKNYGHISEAMSGNGVSLTYSNGVTLTYSNGVSLTYSNGVTPPTPPFFWIKEPCNKQTTA